MGNGGALADLKVVDLTQMLAGPYCTMLLADQGADVVKVEPPEGDRIRRFGPFRPDDALRAFGGYFQSVNRNKRSVVLDLKQEAGRAILLRLIEDADVLVENYRAGVMERLGLSYEVLRGHNPKLVYAAIRGFGDPRTGKSPYVNWPAFDVVAQAMGGLMGITGPDAATPTKVGPGIGDVFPAIMAAFGILAAVHHAQASGHGQFVDVGMVDSVLALCERIMHQYSYDGRIPKPEGNRHPLFCPFGILPAKDGWITVACQEDPFWPDLCRLLGRPDLATDPRFADNESRIRNAETVYGELGAMTRRLTKTDLVRLLGGKVPFGPVYDVGEIAADPHFASRGMIQSIDHPGCARPVEIVGTPIGMTETPAGRYRRAPLLGEDTEAVLTGIGYTDAEIAVWRDAGVVGSGMREKLPTQ
jgi:crotonobetainyl-CoA:carnitine CoA-transferase CaiB-like acyl-CoA transferase